MNVVSLFAGIGGFDLAFERAGATTILQAEIDPVARAVLAAHWPDVQRIEDVHDVSRVDADLICGGFPCTDVSIAGKRAGLAGKQSGLWFEFARILDESRPAWCLIENVPGLLSSNSGQDMGTVLGTLGNLGYGFAYRVLDAQFFGVPQRRRRVFIVGHLGDARRAGEILLEREGGNWNPPTLDNPREDLAGTLAARTTAGGYPGTDESCLNHVVAFRKSTRAHRADDFETWEEAAYANTLDAEGNVTRTAHAIAYSVYPRSGQGSELRAREIGTAPALSATDGKLHDRGTRIVEESGVRKLMPIECERLQGFPDGWTEGHPDTARYRMLGNAVAVPVVEWIARRIVAASEGVDVGETSNVKTVRRREHAGVTRGGRARTASQTAPSSVAGPSSPTPPAPLAALAPVKHCAKFSDALLPIALDMLVTRTTLKPNARIIDTFAGTGKGVDYLRAHSKFRAEGLELEPEFIASECVKVGDATSTGYRKNTFDGAFWSPSYGNRMADKDMRESVAGTYAKSLGRLASPGSSCHMQWDAGSRGNPYRELHVDAYTELRRIMRDGGWALLNIKDHPRGKQLQHVPEWHVQTLIELGFVLKVSEFVKTPGQRRGANKDTAVDGEWLYLFQLSK